MASGHHCLCQTSWFGVGTVALLYDSSPPRCGIRHHCLCQTSWFGVGTVALLSESPTLLWHQDIIASVKRPGLELAQLLCCLKAPPPPLLWHQDIIASVKRPGLELAQLLCCLTAPPCCDIRPNCLCQTSWFGVGTVALLSESPSLLWHQDVIVSVKLPGLEMAQLLCCLTAPPCCGIRTSLSLSNVLNDMLLRH